MSQFSKQIEEQYQRASINTTNNLRTIAESLIRDDLSQLSLPEIEQVTSSLANINCRIESVQLDTCIIGGKAPLHS